MPQKRTRPTPLYPDRYQAIELFNQSKARQGLLRSGRLRPRLSELITVWL